MCSCSSVAHAHKMLQNELINLESSTQHQHNQLPQITNQATTNISACVFHWQSPLSLASLPRRLASKSHLEVSAARRSLHRHLLTFCCLSIQLPIGTHPSTLPRNLPHWLWHLSHGLMIVHPSLSLHPSLSVWLDQL